MEVPESTQRHTRVILKQIDLVLFTLCDGSFVFCDVAAEISAQVMVRRQITRSICTHWSMFTPDCPWQRSLAVRYNIGFLEQNGGTH